ncbi:hypothetical protein KIW84_065695, partial [Lathyrus oleraceus]
FNSVINSRSFLQLHTLFKMIVNFVRVCGESFTLELNHFHTFMEVKKIIEKYLNIPISKQTLTFNNQLLDDADIILTTSITHSSTIHLRTTPDTAIKNPEPQEAPAEAPATPPIKNPEPQRALAEAPATPPIKNPEPQRAPATASPESESRTLLSVTVVPRATRGEGNFIVSEIEPLALVSDLKIFLESNKKNVLPQDGDYFFIHNRDVMYEDRSFEWHAVKDGDMIGIFDGVVDDNCLGDRQVRRKTL